MAVAKIPGLECGGLLRIAEGSLTGVRLVNLRKSEELWPCGEVAALELLDLDTEIYPDGVRQAPHYFAGRAAAVRYADFRVRGYPIGSGMVESAVGNLVQPRMRCPGRGWHRDNADAMPAALGEFRSDRLLWAWQQATTA